MERLARTRMFWRWEDDGLQRFVSFQWPRTNEIHLMNPVGSLIFSLCDREHTLDDIVNVLCERFSRADRQRIAQDTESYVRYLMSEGLVEPICDGGSVTS